jgi:acylphosphatase
MSGVIRRRVIVGGRVQGVWFRETTRRSAQAHGVAGWVCNRADGRVEAVFEGDASAVESLVGFCREGPERAAVTEFEVDEEEPEGLEGFRVR